MSREPRSIIERAEAKAREKEAHALEMAERAETRAFEMAQRAEEKAERARERAARTEAKARERAERAEQRAAERSGEGVKDAEASIWMRPEPHSRRPSHTRAEIAAAAVEIADAEGFEAVSMRRVAERLGAGTMTLYHYVRNKDELVTLMTDTVMGEILIPEEDLRGGWRKALERIAIHTREVFVRHRWALERIGDDERPGPNGMRHFEQSLAAVADLDVSGDTKFELIGQVDDYVFGFALREAVEQAERETRWPEETLAFFQRELDSGDFPLIREFLGEEAEEGIQRVNEFFSRGGRFERGLERLLDGIEAHVDPPEAKKPGK